MMLLRGFLIAVILWFMAVILVASYTYESYATTVHPHGELALTGYNEKGVQSTLTSGFFVRFPPMRSHIYASREGRTSSDVLVTFFTSLSTDPFGLHQSNDSDVQAFNQEKGAHSHA